MLDLFVLMPYGYFPHLQTCICSVRQQHLDQLNIQRYHGQVKRSFRAIVDIVDAAGIRTKDSVHRLQLLLGGQGVAAAHGGDGHVLSLITGFSRAVLSIHDDEIVRLFGTLVRRKLGFRLEIEMVVLCYLRVSLVFLKRIFFLAFRTRMQHVLTRNYTA